MEDIAEDLGEIRGESLYKLTRKIAQGGMGVVYEAKQLGAEGFVKKMAVKTILPRYTGNREFVNLFIGEARLVANLVHENIVQIYQLGRDASGMYYIAMEYMDGINLDEFLERHKNRNRQVDLEMACFIISRACRALQYAHSKRDDTGKFLGIVHRDVSPKNIMINREGVVRITDFGVSKATMYMEQQEGEVLMGKVEYMSPEQADYQVTDCRSDIFSLGTVFYELLTGENIFAVDDVYETLDRVKGLAIPDPALKRSDIPSDVSRILSKAMCRDLSERYQTAGQMCYDLEYYMYHDRFGPTNITLANYMAGLDKSFGAPGDPAGDGIVPYSETIYEPRKES